MRDFGKGERDFVERGRNFVEGGRDFVKGGRDFVERGRVAASAAYLFRFHCLCSLCLHSGCAALPRLSPHPPR